MAMHHDKMPTPVSQGVYMDERLDALLSITGRMDGYLYRCRNDASYTMLYISDGMLTVSGYPPSDFIHNQVRDYVSAIHPDDLPRSMPPSIPRSRRAATGTSTIASCR